jgi:hypothetical protein
VDGTTVVDVGMACPEAGSPKEHIKGDSRATDCADASCIHWLGCHVANCSGYEDVLVRGEAKSLSWLVHAAPGRDCDPSRHHSW